MICNMIILKHFKIRVRNGWSISNLFQNSGTLDFFIQTSIKFGSLNLIQIYGPQKWNLQGIHPPQLEPCEPTTDKAGGE